MEISDNSTEKGLYINTVRTSAPRSISEKDYSINSNNCITNSFLEPDWIVFLYELQEGYEFFDSPLWKLGSL